QNDAPSHGKLSRPTNLFRHPLLPSPESIPSRRSDRCVCSLRAEGRIGLAVIRNPRLLRNARPPPSPRTRNRPDLQPLVLRKELQDQDQPPIRKRVRWDIVAARLPRTRCKGSMLHRTNRLVHLPASSPQRSTP